MDWKWLLKSFCMMLTELWEHLPSRVLTKERVTWEKAEFTKQKANESFPSLCMMAATVSAQQGEILQICGGQWKHWSALDVLRVQKQKVKATLENRPHDIMAFPKTAIIVELMGSEEGKQDFWKIKEIRCWSRKWWKPKAEKERGWMKCSCGTQINILKWTTYSKIPFTTFQITMVFSPLLMPELLLNP